MGVSKDVKLAELWVTLAKLDDCIENQVLPLAGYLGLTDADKDGHGEGTLIDALEAASIAIKDHFRSHRLQARHVEHLEPDQARMAEKILSLIDSGAGVKHGG